MKCNETPKCKVKLIHLLSAQLNKGEFFMDLNLIFYGFLGHSSAKMLNEEYSTTNRGVEGFSHFEKASENTSSVGSVQRVQQEERGMLKNKFSDLTQRENLDADQILSELIDSHCSHSYHSNFKDSFRHLASPKKKRRDKKSKLENYDVDGSRVS